jgi:hypothetical protein
MSRVGCPLFPCAIFRIKFARQSFAIRCGPIMTPRLRAFLRDFRRSLSAFGLRLLRWHVPHWEDDPAKLKPPGMELPIGILLGALIPGFIEIIAHGEYPERWTIAVCLALATGGLALARPEKWIKWGLYVGLGWVLLIAARIIWEVNLGIASHNLFPFTLVSFAAVSFPSTFAGAFAGRFMIAPLLGMVASRQMLLGGALVALAVFAGLAVALMRSAELTANETYALEKVRALVAAQQRYVSRYGKPTCSLSKLDETFPEPITQGGGRARVTHRNYIYSLACPKDPETGRRWVSLRAKPNFRDIRAHFQFCIDQEWQVRRIRRGKAKCHVYGDVVR